MITDETNQSSRRGQWSSTFGFVMAAAGSAVGLGNLWKFPYLVGQNGGSVFIVLYLFFLMFIGLSLVIAEITVGRFGQLDPVGSFALISPKLKWVGAIGTLTAFLILIYYPLVGGWILYYLYHSVVSFGTNPDYAAIFGQFISDPYLPVIALLIFSLLNYAIVALGVEKGIEKYSKIMMPALLIILIVVAVRTLTLDAKSIEGLRFLLRPDFSKISGKMILTALGQVFFSLSIGMGALITYGSYLKKEDNIINSALSIPLVDTAVALLAAIAIMPAVFAFGFEPTQGPSLIFVTLPAVFAKMPMGSIISALFFLLMLFAALTSSISLLESSVAYLIDKLHWKRFNAATVVSLAVFLLGVPCALGFGPLKAFELLPGKGIFDTLDFIASNILLPFSGMMICISVGWLWDKGLRNETIIIKRENDTSVATNGFVLNDCLKEITNQGTANFPFMAIWVFIIKWVCPLVILAIFLDNL